MILVNSPAVEVRILGYLTPEDRGKLEPRGNWVLSEFWIHGSHNMNLVEYSTFSQLLTFAKLRFRLKVQNKKFRWLHISEHTAYDE